MIDYTLLDELKSKARISYYDLFRVLGTDAVSDTEMLKVLSEVKPRGDRMPRIFYDGCQGADSDSFLGLLKFIGADALKSPSELDIMLKDNFKSEDTMRTSLLYLAHIAALVFYESEPEIISYNEIFTDVFKYLFDGLVLSKERVTDSSKLIYEVHGIACDSASRCYIDSLYALVSACRAVKDDCTMFKRLSQNATKLMYFRDERFMRLLELYLEGMSMSDVISEFKREFNYNGLCMSAADADDEDLLPIFRLRPMLLEHLIDEAYVDIMCMKCSFRAGMERIESCRNKLEEEFMQSGGYLN